MKKKSILALCLIAILITSCASTGPLKMTYSTSSLESSRNGKNITKIHDGDLTVVLSEAYAEDYFVSFLVGIQNTGKEDVTFNDTSFSLYNGKASKDRWTLIGRWDSTAFLSQQQAEVDAALALTAMGGVVDLFKTASDYSNNRSDRNPVESVLGTTGKLLSIGYKGEKALDLFESNMIMTTVLKPGDMAYGWMFFPTDDVSSRDFRLIYSGATVREEVLFRL